MEAARREGSWPMSVFLSLLADQRPTRVTSRGEVETGETGGVSEPEKRGSEGDRMLLLMRVPVREAPEAGSSSHQQLGPGARPSRKPAGQSLGFLRVHQALRRHLTCPRTVPQPSRFQGHCDP